MMPMLKSNIYQCYISKSKPHITLKNILLSTRQGASELVAKFLREIYFRGLFCKGSGGETPSKVQGQSPCMVGVGGEASGKFSMMQVRKGANLCLK